MKKYFLIVSRPVLLSFLFISLQGCYRMPTEEDFSIVPTTNNPAVTCEKAGSITPGISY